MKEICAFAFLALVAVAHGICPKGEDRDALVFPNWLDCGSYYVCTNDRFVLFRCPEGLEFNPRDRVCDWPETARCYSVPKLFATTTTVKPVDTLASSPCPAEDGDYAVTFANSKDCSTFFLCSYGTPVLRSCPEGLEFNASLGVCDWPENAACVVTTPRPRPTTTTRRPTTTTRRPTTTTRRPTTTTRRPTTTTRRPTTTTRRSNRPRMDESD